MIARLIGLVLDFFDTRTARERQEDQQRSELIREALARYPSLRVTGRGAVHVDPSEVYADPGFQEDLKRAAKLVNKDDSK